MWKCFFLFSDSYWLKHVEARPNTLAKHQNMFVEEESLKQL